MTGSQLKLKHIGLLLVVTPILLSLIFNGILTLLILDAEKSYDKQLESTSLALQLHDNEQVLADAFCQIASRLPTNDPQFEVECDRLLEKMSGARKDLNQWRKQRIVEKKTLDEILDLTEESAKLVKKAKRVFKDKTIKPSSRHKHLDGEMRSIIFRANSLVTELSVYEENVKLNIANLLFQKSAILWLFFYGGLFFIAIISVALVLLFSKRIANRLSIVHQNAEQLAIGKVVEKELQGDDELKALNQVLIESSSTIQRMKEKELAILNNTNEVLCSLDQSLRFTNVGASCKKLWGFEEADLLATPVANLINPSDRDRTITRLKESIKNKKESSFDFKLKKQDGTMLRTEWTASWNQDSNRLYCIARDITKRTELEKMKARFLSSVSHDLRTPLSSIMHSFNLIIEKPDLPSKVKTSLDKGKMSISRLLRLVEELLEIDKMESGKLTVEPAFVSSYDITLEAIDAVEWFATNRRVKIEHRIEDLAMLGDEKRLVQVLTNLLSNAIKFSPEDSTVSVTVFKSGEYARFEIKDMGPGIPDQDRELIFERYSQLRSSGKGAIKGTGLGLAICSAIIKAHEAKIGVDSEQGKGSTFWFLIPLLEEGGSHV